MNYMQHEMRMAKVERLTKPPDEQSDAAEQEVFNQLFKEDHEGAESCLNHFMRVMQTYEWQMEQL